MPTVTNPDDKYHKDQTYEDEYTRMDEIMHSHEVVVAEEAETEQTINGNREATAKLHQEPEVITYGTTIKIEEDNTKIIRTKTDQFAHIQDDIKSCEQSLPIRAD